MEDAKLEDFKKIKADYSECRKCLTLVESRTQIVFGDGNPDSKILFIGEAPGASEDKLGVPFCGMSGKVLSELLSSANLKREDIYITNTVLCRPPNNRNPKTEEMDNCHERLNRLIHLMQPTVIVTIGNFATERILGRSGINSMRGKVFRKEFEGFEAQIVPVIHPASYLYSGRDPEMYSKMKKDFQTIAEIMGSHKFQKSITDY